MKPALILLLGILFVACAAKQGEPMAFPTTCNDADDGKYVAITGYLTDGGTLYCSNTGGRMDCNFDLTEKPGGGAKIGASIASPIPRWSGSATGEGSLLRSRYRS